MSVRPRDPICSVFVLIPFPPHLRPRPRPRPLLSPLPPLLRIPTLYRVTPVTDRVTAADTPANRQPSTVSCRTLQTLFDLISPPHLLPSRIPFILPFPATSPFTHSPGLSKARSTPTDHPRPGHCHFSFMLPQLRVLPPNNRTKSGKSPINPLSLLLVPYLPTVAFTTHAFPLATASHKETSQWQYQSQSPFSPISALLAPVLSEVLEYSPRHLPIALPKLKHSHLACTSIAPSTETFLTLYGDIVFASFHSHLLPTYQGN